MTWEDNDGEKLSDALTWLTACKVQIARYLQGEAISADLHGRGRTDEQRQQLTMGWVDGHFLCVAAKHLGDALDRIRTRHGIGQLNAETRKNAEHMRHQLEHWTTRRWQFQHRNRADDEETDRNPWSRGWSNTSGHTFGVLSVDQLATEIAAIEPRLVTATEEYREERGPRPIPFAVHDQTNAIEPRATPSEAALSGWATEPEVVSEWAGEAYAFVLVLFEDENWPKGFPFLVQLLRVTSGWVWGGGSGGSGGFYSAKRDGRFIGAEVREVEATVHSATCTWPDGVSTTVEARGGWVVAVREDAGEDDGAPTFTMHHRPASA